MIIIVKAAVMCPRGFIFTGKNHAEAYKQAKQTGRPADTKNHVFIQGFVTNDGIFVSRTEAARIAFAAGQTDELKNALFSEDIKGEYDNEQGYYL